MKNVKKKLNVFLTVLVILCALLCVVLTAQILQGREANIFGYRVCHIITGSMEPELPTGSTILVKRVDPAELKVGDVINFTSWDPQIYGMDNTHRIIRMETDASGEPCFVTKGDANKVEDESRVAYSDVKGKVVFNVNLAGLSSFLSFVRTKAGFVTVVILPLMLLTWSFVRDFKRQFKETVRQNAEAQLRAEQDSENEDKEEENCDQK